MFPQRVKVSILSIITVEKTTILKRECTKITKTRINTSRHFSVCTGFACSWEVLSNATCRLRFPQADRTKSSLATWGITAHIQLSVSTPTRTVSLRLRPSGRSAFHKTYTGRSVPDECSRNTSGLASCTRTERVHNTGLRAEHSSKNTKMSDIWKRRFRHTFCMLRV